MKKTLISGIAMVALTVGAANADKQSCDNSPKNIWDAKDSVCVPKDPCNSRLYKNNERYCNRAFAKTQVASVDVAQRLINIYVQAQLGSKGHCKEFLPINGDGDAKKVGDDYIGCVTQEGAFVSFQFDDVSETLGAVSDGSFYRAACMVLGGSPDGEVNDAVKVVSVAVAGVAVVDQVAKASISGCVGITKTQCGMISPMAGYNEHTKLCQFYRD